MRCYTGDVSSLKPGIRFSYPLPPKQEGKIEAEPHDAAMLSDELVASDVVLTRENQAWVPFCDFEWRNEMWLTPPTKATKCDALVWIRGVARVRSKSESAEISLLIGAGSADIWFEQRHVSHMFDGKPLVIASVYLVRVQPDSQIILRRTITTRQPIRSALGIGTNKVETRNTRYFNNGKVLRVREFDKDPLFERTKW